MAVKLRRPILVGGVGLSFALWVLQSWHHSIVQLGEYGVLGAIAVGGTLWFFQQKSPKIAPEQPVTKESVIQAIAQAQSIIEKLAVEAENYDTTQLREKIALLNHELDRQELQVAIVGGKAVGKTTLLQVLANEVPTQISFKETPALFTGTDTDLNVETATLAAASSADLVLFVTNGDLTDPEFQSLQQIVAVNHQRTLLVFNKQDQYVGDDRAAIIHTLQQRMQLLPSEDVLGIAASPNAIKVRQHSIDGSVQERCEQPAPDLQPLRDRLRQIVTQEAQQLVWATTQRQALALQIEAKTQLNAVRRDRALPVIEQYQWIAAAAAFANPVPALDLLATAAINAQLVVELGNIYQQKFSLQQAQTVAGTMGSLMVKLGLVELSSKAIGIVLKSNAMTFVAGGALQGVSAAYLTRLAGLSLVEYFQLQEVAVDSASGLNLDKLSQTLQQVFRQNQQLPLLQGFVKQGIERLIAKSPQPQLTES